MPALRRDVRVHDDAAIDTSKSLAGDSHSGMADLPGRAVCSEVLCTFSRIDQTSMSAWNHKTCSYILSDSMKMQLLHVAAS